MDFEVKGINGQVHALEACVKVKTTRAGRLQDNLNEVGSRCCFDIILRPHLGPVCTLMDGSIKDEVRIRFQEHVWCFHQIACEILQVKAEVAQFIMQVASENSVVLDEGRDLKIILKFETSSWTYMGQVP